MKMSVLISVVGLPDEHPYHETSYRDVRRACEAAGLAIDESDPGDHDYEYLAREDGLRQSTIEEIRAHWRIFGDDCPTYRRADYRWAERLGIEGCELRASGIIDRDAWTTLADAIGAYAEDVETLGTLGGPLSPWGGIVPGISFRMETSGLLECIRVTPVPCRADGTELTGDERTWDRLRSAMLAVYGS